MKIENQQKDRADKPLASGYRGLFYITHIDNLPSILKHGIFCHERIERDKIKFTPIYDEAIVAGRRERKVPDGRSLWSFANLFFQPRNAMLYRVLLEKSSEEVAILCVKPELLNRKDVYIAVGGAGSERSAIVSRDVGLKAISKLRKYIDREWWSDVDDSKRLSMAECLVPDSVSADAITTIYVVSHELRERLLNDVRGLNGVNVIPDPYMFFRPEFQVQLTDYLSLIKGDMFFSKMHTLTISVNCVGVMGKGVASRAKYLFPGAYVYYQELCRERKLQLGKPYLYKRENSVEIQLADEPFSLPQVNTVTWYLLFPTKYHWRFRADLDGIKKGLQWIQDNYRKEGIQSLALPALGCGLGWLEWKEVGPVLCHHLSTLDIPVQIYLPTERDISKEQLTKEFLLS
jgi:hypothetical protein